MKSSPDFIGISGATSICNRLIPSVTQILWNVFSCLHVCDIRELDIFADLIVGPNQIGAGHSDKLTKAADNATVVAMEVRFEVGFTISVRKANVGFHRCDARWNIPRCICSQNLVSSSAFERVRASSSEFERV